MRELTSGQWQSFTARYSTLVYMLTTPVRVGAPFDPKQAASADGSLDLTAIWDTGATGTVITKAIAERLGLKPIRLAKGSTVGGGIRKQRLPGQYVPSQHGVHPSS